jgi:beta-1,4-mannosyl-glycoprotein beta-1,4-N-acetylglucosaminyltransferase
MKVFDCFMYFDEEIVLDLRLNMLDPYVDYFVIVESLFTHKGDKRKLKFNHEKFNKFKKKIIYLIYDEKPKEIEPINDEDSEYELSRKFILNAAYRENGQRDFITRGLSNAEDDDLILVSDVDEITNLENIDLKKINQRIILFKQNMFYYKFNLKLPNLEWYGTKGCKKKYLKSPQWLRNIKDKKYPFYRVDTYFSEKKYINLMFINNGGWHFSNIKTANEIRYKLKSYLHHREFDVNPMTANEIENIIENKQAIYDLTADKTVNKIGNGNKLEKFPLIELPKYIQNNLEKFKIWID